MALNAGVRDYGSNQISGPSTGEFNKLRHVINENTQRIRRNNAQMQRMVSQIGSSTDSVDLRDKLHKLQHQTNQLAKETNQNLQSLVTLPLIPSSAKQQRQVRDQLTEEFTKVLKDFQSLQRSEMDEEKSALTRQRNDQGPILDIEQEHLSSDLFGGSSGQQQLFQESQDIKRLEETEGQIRKLESDISDINQVFRDLSLLVHQQSEFVDSIEANTESATISISRGTEELLKARQYRDKIRKRKVILIACITIFVAIILLIIIAATSRGG